MTVLKIVSLDNGDKMYEFNTEREKERRKKFNKSVARNVRNLSVQRHSETTDWSFDYSERTSET